MILDHRPIYVERVDDPAQLRMLEFNDDHAEIEVPGYALQSMPFELKEVATGEEYWRAVELCRRDGHNNARPITVWPTEIGRWTVEGNDAVRLAAVKHVAGEFLANLFGNKVRKVRFSLSGTSADGQFKAPRFDLGGGD